MEKSLKKIEAEDKIWLIENNIAPLARQYINAIDQEKLVLAKIDNSLKSGLWDIKVYLYLTEKGYDTPKTY